MKIDWWTLALQAVNALVLIWLLAHFLFRPVVNAIAARQKAVGQLLADATAAKAAAESEREKAAAETAGLAAHRSEALKAAEAEAATEKAALLAEAQAEADKLRAAAKAEIEAARRTEALAAEDRAGRLAVDIATKLLDRLPREARVAAFIDGIATGLAKLPEGTRASVGADGTSVHLMAARAVTPEESGDLPQSARRRPRTSGLAGGIRRARADCGSRIGSPARGRAQQLPRGSRPPQIRVGSS